MEGKVRVIEGCCGEMRVRRRLVDGGIEVVFGCGGRLGRGEVGFGSLLCGSVYEIDFVVAVGG